MHPKNEYSDFLENTDHKPTPATSDRIYNFVSDELNPSPTRAFSKLLLIHIFSAALTLSICPQFGFRLLGEGHGLMQIFMAFGTYGCLVACGAFFTGTSYILGSLLLSRSSLNAIYQHKVLGALSISFISLGFFIMIDAQIFFGLAVAWIIGSVSSGVLVLHFSRKFV